MSFYKHVHGDNGAGFNTSHQTGWSSTVARLMHPFVTNAAEQVLLVGEAAAVTDVRA